MFRILFQIGTFAIFFVCKAQLQQVSSNIVTRAIFEAATDVLKLHENYEEQDANSIGDRRKRSAELGSEQNDVPTFESEMSQFRHGYIPMTGTGNREEMKIDPLTPLKLLVNPKPKSTPGSWKYKRFNSSDFVMLHSTHEVHIWRKTFTEEDEIFHFDLKRTLCSVGDTNEGEVLHSLFYTQRENFIETLHFAYVLNLPSGGYELRDYDISMEDCVHSRITKLDNRHPKSLKYVETDNLKSFVILYIDVHENPQIKCIDCRKRFETKLIEISVAYVTDLETFTINGDAFAAVAHKNGVDVYIIEEKVENSRWIDGRSILGVTDLISFRIGFKYFLGIATEMGPQHLLLWNDEKFIDEQLFDIKGVKQWDAIHIETCREDVILVFYSIGHEAPISLFIWNGNTHRFNLAIDDLRRTSPLKLDVHPFTQTFFVHNAVVNILYLDSNSDTRVIPLQTRLVPLADPVSVSVNYITKILTKIGERFKQQDLFVEKFKNLLKDAVRPDKDVHVLFPQVFNKIEVLRRTTLRDIKHVTNVIWKNSQLTLNDLSYTIGDLRKRLGHLKNEIGKIRSEMDDVVFRNVPSKIFGKVTFRGSVDIASINASNLIINEIANEPLSPILNNVYQIGRTNVPIIGHKTFNNVIDIRRSLRTRSINGLNLHRDAVLKHRENRINGKVLLNFTTVRRNLNFGVNCTVNQIRFPEDLIFLRGRSYNLSATKRFTHPITQIEALDATLVDGVDIKNIAKTVLLTRGSQKISSPIITERHVSMRNIAVRQQFNGMNFRHFINDLVRIDQPAIIVAPKRILNDVKIRESMSVEQLMNGLRVPLDLVTTNSPQKITARKIFRGRVMFNEPVKVDRLVDGLILPQSVIPLTPRMVPVNSSLYFAGGITAMKDFDIRGKLDGIDLSHFEAIALKRDSAKLPGSTIFRGPVEVINNMNIRGFANGVNLRHIYNDAIFRDSRGPIHIRGRKEFQRVVEIPRFFPRTIDGHPLSNFVNTRNARNIYSNVVFAAPVTFKEVFIDNGRVSGVNIPQLMKRRLDLNDAGTIADRQRFENIKVDSLVVKGLVNGIRPERDIVLRSTPQVIPAPKIFTNAVTFASGITLKGNSSLTARGLIDGVNIPHILANRITLSSEQRVPMKILVANSTFENVVLNRENSMNGINFNRFIGSILYKTGNQVIIAPKNFKKLVVIGNITSKNGINGVSLRFLRDKAMRLNGNQLIRASAFSDDLYINGNLNVQGLVNGMDLRFFAFDAVRKHKPNEFKGVNTFLNGFEVRGDIRTRSLNGFNPFTDLMKKFGNHRIGGHIVFRNLEVNGDVLMDGRLNGLILVDFDKKIMKTNRPNVLHGTVIFKNSVNIMENLFVAGLINRANFTNAVTHGFRRFGEQEVPGTLTFRFPSTFLSNIHAERINGVLMKEFLEDLVYLKSRRQQLITAPKIFAHGFSVEKDLEHKYGEAVIYGLINNINLRQFADSVLRVDRPGEITGRLTFNDKVYVSSGRDVRLIGRINGVNINHDIVLLNQNPGNGPQMIRGLQFDQLTAHSDIFVHGFVNGIKLENVARDTLLKRGDQLVTGRKLAFHRITLEQGAIVGRLNDFNGLHRIVTLNGNRVITGHWIFADPVLSIHGNLFVHGLLGSANLHQLAHESLLKNKSQLISHPIAFENVVFQNNVRVVGLINGVNFTEFSAKVNNFRQIINETQQRMTQLLNENFALTTKIESIVKPSFAVDYFVLSDSLKNVEANEFESHGDSNFTIRDVSEVAPQATVYTFKFNTEMQQFEEKNVQTRRTHLKEKPFKFINLHYTAYYGCSKTNYTASILRQNDKVLGTFGNNIDDIKYVVNNFKREVFFAALSSRVGEVYIHLLYSVAGEIKFRYLGKFSVGRGATKIEAFSIERNYYVAVARNFEGTCPTSDSGSLIFAWEERSQFRLIQNLPVSNANDVLYYKNEKQHYLVISDVTPIEDNKVGPRILVYRYKQDDLGCPFRLFQKLEFDNLRGLTAFRYGTIRSQQMFLAAVNSSALVVWKQDGHSGFNQNWSMRAVDGHFVEPVLVNKKRLFLIVGQRKSCAGLFVYEAVAKCNSALNLFLKSSFNVITKS